MADTYSTMPLPQYCSRRCSAKYYQQDARRRSGRFVIADRVRFEIYERDGWLCQLCFEPTSRRYEHDDPWSPTLDHIIHRSKGGADDPENLRLAHSMCNSIRGDEEVEPSELLDFISSSFFTRSVGAMPTV